MSSSYQPRQACLYPQRFDYAPVDDFWAAVWLETPLDDGVDPPASPILAIRCAAVETLHPAFLSCTQRLRADGTRQTAGAVPDVLAGYVLWRARFPVPLEVVDDPEAQFMLRASDGVAMALPLPASLAAIAVADLVRAGERLFAVRIRRHAATLAAGVAVASMPVTAAVADTGTVIPQGTSTTSGQTTPPPTSTTAAPPATTTSTTTPTSTPPPSTPPTDTTTTAAPATPPPAPPPPAPPPTATPPSATTPTPSAAPAALASAPPAAVKSEGSSIPTPSSGSAQKSAPAKAPPKRQGSHTTTKHRTSLRCKVPAASTPKLSKAALAKLSKAQLAELKRAEAKAKCAPAANTNTHQTKTTTHKGHNVARPGRHERSSISGGARLNPVTAVPSSATAAPAAGSLLFANPTAVSAWSRLSMLFASGDRPPSFLIPIYRAAGRKYHVPWPVLAAINAIETDYGRNVETSSAGAIGWMQFMPETWLEFGVVAGNHALPDPYDPRDAIFSAARYLAANGARRHLRKAIFAYNHANWYVDEVLWTAADIIDHTRVRGSGARIKVDAMQAMALALDGEPYVWGGGHGGWDIAGGYDCSGFVSAVLHAGGYLRTPVTTQALPAQRHILPGPGRYVTIFDRTDGGALNQDHVIIDLHGQWWESGGSDAAGGVHRIKRMSASYLLTFNQILHPRGL